MWYSDVPDEGLFVIEKDGIGILIIEVFVDDIVEIVPIDGDLDFKAIIESKKKKE